MIPVSTAPEVGLRDIKDLPETCAHFRCKHFRDWRPPQLRPSTLLMLQRVLATLALQTSHGQNVQPGASKEFLEPHQPIISPSPILRDLPSASSRSFFICCCLPWTFNQLVLSTSPTENSHLKLGLRCAVHTVPTKTACCLVACMHLELSSELSQQFQCPLQRRSWLRQDG